ncbi:hypothetical protein Tco_1526953, partial [Tanacetum coccineum]
GNDIQVNTDVDDARCLNPIDKVGSAYIISVFGCAATDKLQQTLANKMSLEFGSCAMFENMPAYGFLNPFFIFTLNNQIGSEIPHPACQPRIQRPILTGCVRLIKLILFGVLVKKQVVK